MGGKLIPEIHKSPPTFFVKQNKLRWNTFMDVLQDLSYPDMDQLKKCPNFIRTIGRHFDNLMKWLVRLGSIK